MRKNHIIISIDYETWQPIPVGEEVCWQQDLISNTEEIMRACEQIGAKLTLMVEMCEYFWLCDNDLEMAKKVESQLKDAVLRGHDVQLHIHPNWMPELNADCKAGRWYWDWRYASCNDFPYDLTKLVNECKLRLEEIVREVKPDYSVRAFRAGAYRVQPFRRISEALKENNIHCDMSVYKGGVSRDRGYSFRKCKHNSSPYYASMDDPQLDSNNKDFIELPITVFRNKNRWFFDNNEAQIFGERFLRMDKSYFSDVNNFFVLIGHSKGKHDLEAVKTQLKILKNYPNTSFCTVSDSYKEIVNMLESDIKCRKAKCSLEEVTQIMTELYNNIQPDYVSGLTTVESVLIEKKALCYGYSIVLLKILKQYGYKAGWVTLFAEQMPKGRGKRNIDTHEIIELTLEKKRYILDCTTNTIIPHGLKEVLRRPCLAGDKKEPDSRYIERSYKYYDTRYLYERVIYYLRRTPYELKIENDRIFYRFLWLCKMGLTCIISGKIRIYNRYRIYKNSVDAKKIQHK